MSLDHHYHSMLAQVTYGGLQSAHTAAVAAACAEQGLAAHLLLRGEPPPKGPAGNFLVSRLYGQVTHVSRGDYADRQGMVQQYCKTLASTLPATAQVTTYCRWLSRPFAEGRTKHTSLQHHLKPYIYFLQLVCPACKGGLCPEQSPCCAGCCLQATRASKMSRLPVSKSAQAAAKQSRTLLSRSKSFTRAQQAPQPCWG